MLENLTQWIPEEVLHYLERTSAASAIIKGKEMASNVTHSALLFSQWGRAEEVTK